MVSRRAGLSAPAGHSCFICWNNISPTHTTQWYYYTVQVRRWHNTRQLPIRRHWNIPLSSASQSTQSRWPPSVVSDTDLLWPPTSGICLV